MVHIWNLAKISQKKNVGCSVKFWLIETMWLMVLRHTKILWLSIFMIVNLLVKKNFHLLIF